MKEFKGFRGFFCIIAALVMLLTGIESVQAATITVTPDAPDVLNGANGNCALREAITNVNNAANTYADCAATGAYGSSDTITLPEGIYVTSIAGTNEHLNANGDYDIRKSVIINGGGGTTSVVQGDGSERVFHLVNTGVFSVTFNGVFIINGADSTGNGGGGIYQDDVNGSLTINDCTIEGSSTTGRAGGVRNNSGTLTMNNVIVRSNSAYYGGAVSCNTGNTCNLTGVTISSNTAQGYGGGIENNGNMTLTDSVISGNTANTSGTVGDGGGGIYNGAGTLTITGTTISNNIATAVGSGGGGILNRYMGATINISKSTISGNQGLNAGGIYNQAAVTATNVTISGNDSNQAGGAVQNSFDGSEPCTFTCTNCTITKNDTLLNLGNVQNNASCTSTFSNTLIADQTARADCAGAGTFTSNGHNLESAATCNFTQGTDIRNTSPNLVALANNGGGTNTHALQAGSAAINAGDCNGGAVTTDQRGTARPQGVACDIGAYEYPVYTVTPSAGAGGTINPNTPQTINGGSTTTFTVTPNAGYTALVGGTCGGALVGTTYTTNVITADCTVSASFTLNTYTVTPSSGAGGTIAPNSPQTINHGSTTIFTVTPNAGYSISSTGGSCGGALVGNTYTTNVITANCTVTASFTLNTYTVTPSAGAEGTIAPNTPQTINHGSTTTFTVTPNAGYSISSTGGTCGGALVGTTYTTNVITANCTVTASFTLDTPPCSYSLSPSSRSFDISGGTGTVSVTATSGCTWTAASNVSWVSLTSGSSGSGNGTVSFTVAANTGASRNGSLTIAGHSFTITQAGVQYSLVVTKSGTGIGTVNRLYAPNLSFLMFSQLLCGTDCQVALLTYDIGTQFSLNAAPETGANFIGWTGGGCSGTGVCTVTLNADTSINAAFAPVSTPATDKATSMIETIGSDIYVKAPIIKYLNTSNSTTTYYSVEFVYVPANDNKVWLKLTKVDLLTDIAQYSEAQLSQLYQVGSDWRLHLTTIEYNGLSVWADLEYTPTSDGYLWFVVTGSGEN